MEEEDETIKISPVSCKKLISCNVYTWKIPNFFILPEYKDNDFEINSPSFEYQNATWCFSIDSYKNSKDIFSVYVCRLATEIPRHKLFFKFAFSNADVKFKDSSSSCSIYEGIKRMCLKDFKNDFSFQDGCDTLTVTAHLFLFEKIEVDANQASFLFEKDSPYKRPVEMKDSKISFQQTIKTVLSDSYSLTFHYTGSEIISPTFNFANETCCFRVARDGYFLEVFFEVINAKNSFKNIFTKSRLKTSIYDFIGDDYFHQVDLKENCKSMIASFKHTLYSLCTLHVHLFVEEDLEVNAAIMKARSSNLLFQDFKKIFLTGEDSDLTLKVAEKEFRVHRLILKARSKVFEAMLSHDMIEQNKGIVNIPDVDAKAMELLLLYIYSGDVEGLDSDNVLGAYYAADKYNLIFLKEVCAEFIKKSLSPSIICGAIQLALNHNDTDLLKHCTGYFINHVSDILLTSEWMSFLKSNPVAANELYIKANKK